MLWKLCDLLDGVIKTVYGKIRVSNLWYCKKTISEKVEQYAAESIETLNKKKIATTNDKCKESNE